MKKTLHIPPPIIALFVALAVNLIIYIIPQARVVGLRSLTLAIVFFVVSMALAGWAVLTFWNKHTTIDPSAKPNTLVVSGPYRLSRNPMYLGLLLLLLSYTFWQGIAVFFLAPLTFFLIMDKYVIPQEEKTVKQTIGGEYDLYRRSVRRWL